MIDQLTNKEILLLYLSLRESKTVISKSLRKAEVYFNFQKDLLTLDTNPDEIDDVIEETKQLRDVVLNTLNSKLSIIESVVGKLESTAEMIHESDEALYQEVKKIIYDSDATDQIQSIINR
jgi:hypothetical protein